MSKPGRRPNSRSVEWSRLSKRGIEIAKQVGLRVSAGYSYDEIAEAIDADRESVRYLELPQGQITKTWVAARFRELRKEIEETSDQSIA